jgi:hypothetical protein
MRFISETGEPGERRIPLNKPRRIEEGDASASDVFLNGRVGETISLGAEHAAVLITDDHGASLHQVALLDLKNLRVDAIVRTMTASEVRKLKSSQAGKDLLLGMLLPLPVGAGLLANVGRETLANEALAARPDGRYLYALDTDVHGVTVVDVQAAATLKRVPVDHSIIRTGVSSDGKYLLCLPKARGAGAVQRINLETNEVEP